MALAACATTVGIRHRPISHWFANADFEVDIDAYVGEVSIALGVFSHVNFDEPTFARDHFRVPLVALDSCRLKRNR